MSKKESNNYLVTQSNALIQSSQQFTLIERRVLYHILSRINPMVQQREFKLSVPDFLQDFDGVMNSDSVYNQLKEASDKLFKRDLTIVNQEKGELERINWFSYQKYQNKQATITFRFSEEIMPFIFELKEKAFTKMLFNNFKRLNSVHALRLYELLSFSLYSKHTWKEIDIETLRFYLGCQDTYPEFKIFKRDVIEPALKEIFRNSVDMAVKAEYIKKGRKVIKVKFHLYDKEKDTVLLINADKPIKRPSLKRHPNPNNYDFNNENTKIQYQLDCFEWALENYKRLTTYENALKAQNKQLSSKDLELKKRYSSDIAGIYHEFQSNRWDLELLDNLKGNVIDETLEKASQKAKSDKRKIDSIIDQRNKQIELEDLVI